MLLSRRKRLTKENFEDDKARRGKGTSSTTFISSSSSKTTVVMFSSFLPSSSSRVFFRQSRKEEDEVRESHTCNVCWSSSPRKNITLCYILSLSLSRVRDERTMRTPLPIPFIITKRRRWSKSKEKASGRSWETRESRESVLGTRGRLGNPQEKPRGDSVGERYITTTLLLSPRIF